MKIRKKFAITVLGGTRYDGIEISFFGEGFSSFI